MPSFERGLYEQIISEALDAELGNSSSSLSPERHPLPRAEAADRLALYIARIVERVVEGLPEKTRVERGLSIARMLVEVLARDLGDEDLPREAPVTVDPVLRAMLSRRPDGTLESIEGPLTPLLDTTLLTNSPGEPRVGSEILNEIASATRIDLVMAFIRRSGIRPFLERFRRLCDGGGSLRVLTTTYTGSTEVAALEELVRAGADVRVSYDTSSTRLHAKAWLFQRPGGFSTAFIGSSNLTHSAQVSGLEWNVRASGARNPAVIDKIAAVFEAYWQSGDFERFEPADFAERTKVDSRRASSFFSAAEIRLEPFQERLLEEVEVARERGQHRNLLVAATGTGKTVMAAVDYARLRQKLPRSRLLFIAHRKELLDQSLATYGHALRDRDFGELWIGGARPARWEHVFASIQSLSRADLEEIQPDHFDVVVVDEFHHAAAPTYQALLDRVQPRELLGLTATPERADGAPILDWFDGRISAELRLWDAIDQHYLVPFSYFGLNDGLDLTQVPWKRGKGYDVDGLTNLYTANDVWARLVLDQLAKRVDDLEAARVLGFCVSVAHARFMARVFNKMGVASRAVWGDSPAEERADALQALRDGSVRVLFSVDLFNEGVDLPDVDTLLLLRPTDSPTLFLQQLGRGLRKADGKHSCLVLDFVGQHRREFRIDRRLRALLGGSRKHVEQQVESGFPFLPAGCHMEMEPRAREIVLENIRRAVPSRWDAKAEELRQLREEGHGSLKGFLEASGLELEDVYSGTKSWSDLNEAAGIAVAPAGPNEETLRRACGRLLHVDDRARIESYGRLLSRERAPRAAAMQGADRRSARMLIASVCDQALTKDASLQAGIDLLWRHPQVRSELLELLDVLSERIDHQHFELDTHPAVPLRVHARYSRLEILAAFKDQDQARVPAWQSGVYWVPDEKTDLFAFTLDKSNGRFSPTTRYRDFAISRTLIHWESQSMTRADSETGRRYQNHERQGSTVCLFARLRQDERAFWFLGPATYVEHTGERPMAVTWKLRHPLPGDVFASFAAAVA